jgi:mevalonate kinase
MNKASAPGKVILFGEHAVVYDKLGIATSIDRRCYATVIPNDKNKVTLEIRKLNLEKSLTENELFGLYVIANRLKKENKFDEIKELQKREKLSAPFFVIATLMKKYGFRPVKITDESEVPKNLGSGSSAFSAIALALSKFLGANLTKKEISDIAYEGDVIAHGGTPSGIDNSIVTYGGYIRYKKSEGIKTLSADFQLPLLFVDSGESAKTNETVPYVRKQREENKEFVDTVLGKLDSISNQALDAFNSQNLELIGKLMIEYYLELKKLNISTDRLDKIIEISLKHKALGAKPTGGWGGGCCIVLAKDQKQADELIRIYKQNGFNSFQTKIGVEGVRNEL